MVVDKSKIFISYSREDSDFALRLGKDLKSKGLNIWLDQIDILPGRNWDREVEKALDESQKFLIILSESSVSSDNVMDELSYALEEKKLVIPLLYTECKIPFRIRRKQFSDFTNDYIEGFGDLLRAFDFADETAEKDVSQKPTIEPSKLSKSELKKKEEEKEEQKRELEEEQAKQKVKLKSKLEGQHQKK